MSNNYFVVLRPRLSVMARSSEDAEPIPEFESEFARKAARILSRRPLPLDWASYHFFDQYDPISTLRAFEKARSMSAKIAVYQKVPIDGPWSASSIVGDSFEGAN